MPILYDGEWRVALGGSEWWAVGALWAVLVPGGMCVCSPDAFEPWHVQGNTESPPPVFLTVTSNSPIYIDVE